MEEQKTPWGLIIIISFVLLLIFGAIIETWLDIPVIEYTPILGPALQVRMDAVAQERTEHAIEQDIRFYDREGKPIGHYDKYRNGRQEFIRAECKLGLIYVYNGVKPDIVASNELVNKYCEVD